MKACHPLFAISHPQAYSVNLLLQSTHGHWTTFPLASSRLKPAFLRAVIGIPEPQLCANLAAGFTFPFPISSSVNMLILHRIECLYHSVAIRQLIYADMVLMNYSSHGPRISCSICCLSTVVRPPAVSCTLIPPRKLQPPC